MGTWQQAKNLLERAPVAERDWGIHKTKKILALQLESNTT